MVISRVKATIGRALGVTERVTTKLCDTSDRWLDGEPWKSRGAHPLLRAANVLTVNRSSMPIVWLDDCAPAAQLATEVAGISVGPNITGIAVTKPIVLPAVRLYRLTDVTVTAPASVFVCDDGAIVERVEGVDPARCVLLGGHLVWQGRHLGIIQKRRQVSVERGFFLSGYGYFNYYHWMIELLPKLRYWQTLPLELREYPFLVGEAVHRNSSFLDALRHWVKDPDVVVLRDDAAYRVRHMLHINAPNTAPFNLHAGEAARVDDFLTRPEAVGGWRDRMGPSVKVASGGLRLFLARDGVRRAYNQGEVLELFAREGFQPVYLDRLSLREQISLMAAAEFVVGPTGAAWTNLVFCSPGTRALCWMAEQSSGASCYSNIARIVGVDLRYVTYASTARSTGELYLANYHLDVVAVRRALCALLKGR